MASFDKVIPPGQEGKITLSVKTDNMSGKFSKTAVINSNDPTQPTTKIRISGEIKQHITVSPSPRIYLTGYEGEIISKSVTITNNEPSPLKITQTQSTIDDKIDYELKTLVEGKEYELVVKNVEGLQGITRGTITLMTNHEKKPKLEISVSINLRDELTIAPTTLYFGTITLAQEKEKKDSSPQLTKYITITKVKGDPIKIEKVETSSKVVNARVETKEEGKSYTIAVSLNKRKLKAGTELNERLTIHFNYQKKPVAEIDIRGKII